MPASAPAERPFASGVGLGEGGDVEVDDGEEEEEAAEEEDGSVLLAQVEERPGQEVSDAPLVLKMGVEVPHWPVLVRTKRD
jgi:hypothetical protein